MKVNPEKSMRQPLRSMMYSLVFLASTLGHAALAQEPPIAGIEDNSFLIEEAYNQEAGVIQHIFNALYTNDRRHRGWTFSFTDEWPLFSQDHQISITIPSYHRRDDGQRQNGLGDILLNYRYQLLYEGENIPAFAPRFSLIVPSGNRREGTGDGVVGFQWNLPFSKKVSSRVALNANFGLTYLPKVRAPLDLPGAPLSSRHSLVSYNLGGSGIYALSSRVHLMLEWAGLSEESLDDRGKSNRDFKSILSPGVRAAIFNSEDVQTVVGLAVPIGLNRRTENYGAFLYFSFEHKIF
jgi:hypothetical protein